MLTYTVTESAHPDERSAAPCLSRAQVHRYMNEARHLRAEAVAQLLRGLAGSGARLLRRMALAGGVAELGYRRRPRPAPRVGH